jgi:glycopeptide antibiotics resistance protein
VSISEKVIQRWGRYFLFIQWMAAAVYFSLLIYIVFLARRRRHMTERLTNFRPFSGMIERYRYLPHEEQWKTVDFYENLYGNVLLFVPLSIFLITIFGVKNKWFAFLICVVFSAGIELVQYTLKIGVADSDDVILNSLGAALGIGIYAFLRRFVRA